MKRGQVAALVAGAAVGLGCVALGFMLARKEGRDAARRFVDQYGELGQKSSHAAASIANSARQVGERAAKTAAEQYKAQLPKAKEVWSNVVTQAPQAAGALASALSRGTQNGKAGQSETANEAE
jgi:hypothetical protein